MNYSTVFEDEQRLEDIVEKHVYDLIDTAGKKGLAAGDWWPLQRSACANTFRAAVRRGRSVDAATRDLMSFLTEISAPGYYEIGGGYDQFRKKFEPMRHQELLDEAKLRDRQRGAEEAITSLQEYIKGRFPQHWNVSIKPCKRNRNYQLVPEASDGFVMRPFVATTGEASAKLAEAERILDAGVNIHFWTGPSRRGKTHLGVAVAIEMACRGHRVALERASTFVSLFSSNRTVNDKGVEKTPVQHITDYDTAAFLVIDECNPPDGKSALHWEDLIKRRVDRNLKTLIISNYGIDQYLASMPQAETVRSRILQQGAVVDFTGCPAWGM